MAIMMTDLRTAFISGTGPVAAGVIALLPREIGHSVCPRTRQNIVDVGAVAYAIYLIAIFINGRSFDNVRVQMQLIQIACNQFAQRVVPRPLPDPVSCGNTAFAFFLCA